MGQLLLLWKLRTRTSAGLIVTCGALEAAMLYTHLGSVLFLGAEAAMLARAAWRGERNGVAWIALLFGAIAFAPFGAISSRQIDTFITGHRLDWIGAVHHTTATRKVGAIGTAAALLGVFALGPNVEDEGVEPMRWCGAISIIPIAALVPHWWPDRSPCGRCSRFAT